MYSSSNRQHIMRQSSGKTWNFFYDAKLGICFNTLTRRGTWTNPVPLHKDGVQPFHAIIDNEDRFHILFQDRQGNISYSKITGDSIETLPVLNSKTPSVYDKHLCLMQQGNIIHFFYVLKHGESWILAHQLLSGDKVENPRVIDYISYNSCPYSAVIDKSGDIYVFYPVSSSGSLQMGYKKYLPQKSWSEFAAISISEGDSGLPRTSVDAGNIVHISYQKYSQKQYSLMYQQKVPGRNAWAPETVIHSSAYPFEDSAILCLKNSIIVFWVRSEIIYFSTSENSGNTWSKPARYNLPAGRQLFCISYRVNSLYDGEKTVINEIPGSFINGLRLAFLQDLPGNDANLSPEDLKNMIVESLKMLNDSVEELKEAQEVLKDRILKLEHTQGGLEKELAKISVRISMLENQNKKLP